jgi:hypothetical protein
VVNISILSEWQTMMCVSVASTGGDIILIPFDLMHMILIKMMMMTTMLRMTLMMILCDQDCSRISYAIQVMAAMLHQGRPVHKRSLDVALSVVPTIDRYRYIE